MVNQLMYRSITPRIRVKSLHPAVAAAVKIKYFLFAVHDRNAKLGKLVTRTTSSTSAMKHPNYLQIVLLLSRIILSFATRRSPAEQERLYEDLLKNYSKYTRPVNDPERCLNLSFTFELIKVYDVNAKKQRMSIASVLRQEWQDDNLRWNSSDYSGFASLNIPPTKLWVPDIGLYNEIVNKDHKKTDITINVRVSSDGKCLWTIPTFVHVMCSIDVAFFPLDIQHCFLRYGSMVHSTSELNISSGKLVYPSQNFVKNGGWLLYNISIKTRTFWDEIRQNNFTVVEVFLKMERQSLYFVIEMVVPCILIACLTILGFILPPESSERMSLGMLILLSMTFFQQLTMKMFPLQDFPLISQYFVVTTVEIGIALLITTLTINFYYCKDRKMPRLLKIFVHEYLGKITRICPPKDKKEPKRAPRSFRSNVTNTEMVFDIELNESISNTKAEVPDEGLNDSAVGLVYYRHDSEISSKSSDCSSIEKREEQLPDNENLEDPSEWNKDWVLAARIIDRFSMYASFVIGFITVLVIFLRAPIFWRERT